MVGLSQRGYNLGLLKLLTLPPHATTTSVFTQARQDTSTCVCIVSHGTIIPLSPFLSLTLSLSLSLVWVSVPSDLHNMLSPYPCFTYVFSTPKKPSKSSNQKDPCSFFFSISETPEKLTAYATAFCQSLAAKGCQSQTKIHFGVLKV